MNWLKKSNKRVMILVTAAVLGIFSCSEGNQKYLNRTASDWQEYVNQISGKQPTLTNTVLLVLKSKECAPCIEELDWWNHLSTESSTLNVYMIIIEKYESTFTTFLDHHKFEIDAFRDATGLVLEQQLVPKTPVKLYIDEKGEVRLLESININSNPENFSHKISQIID